MIWCALLPIWFYCVYWSWYDVHCCPSDFTACIGHDMMCITAHLILLPVLVMIWYALLPIWFYCVYWSWYDVHSCPSDFTACIGICHDMMCIAAHLILLHVLVFVMIWCALLPIWFYCVYWSWYDVHSCPSDFNACIGHDLMCIAAHLILLRVLVMIWCALLPIWFYCVYWSWYDVHCCPSDFTACIGHDMMCIAAHLILLRVLVMIWCA